MCFQHNWFLSSLHLRVPDCGQTSGGPGRRLCVYCSSERRECNGDATCTRRNLNGKRQRQPVTEGRKRSKSFLCNNHLTSQSENVNQISRLCHVLARAPGGPRLSSRLEDDKSWMATVVGGIGVSAGRVIHRALCSAHGPAGNLLALPSGRTNSSLDEYRLHCALVSTPSLGTASGSRLTYAN
jgi:hypothetical protein